MKDKIKEVLAEFYAEGIPERIMSRDLEYVEKPMSATVVKGMRRTGKTYVTYERIKIGNYGLVGKTTTHELRNLSVRRMEDVSSGAAQGRHLAVVFRGLGSEFLPLTDWLRDFHADEIVDFYMDFRGSLYLPKNNMILDGYPENDLLRQAKLIVLADMPLSADVLSYDVQTNLLAAVSDGAWLLVTDGLLGLEKCGDLESPVARALPGLGNSPWKCPDSQKAVAPYGKGKICIVRPPGRAERWKNG